MPEPENSGDLPGSTNAEAERVMPVYKADIKFEGTIPIELEAMGDAEAGETAAEIFSDMDKGRLNMADIDTKDIVVNRMGSEDLAERKAEARGQI